MRATLAAALIVAGSLLVPGSALAQGALVQGSIAAAVADGETSPAFGGAVTYRFNRSLGFGVELTHIPSLTSNDFPRIYCCADAPKGRDTIFTTNVRLEIPTTSTRIIPFVIGGGGLAAVTRSYSVYYAAAAALFPTGLVLPAPPDIETTTTSMALTLGGGASFLLSEHLAIDADLRVLHLMGDEEQNIGRFGAGVSYRF